MRLLFPVLALACAPLAATDDDLAGRSDLAEAACEAGDDEQCGLGCTISGIVRSGGFEARAKLPPGATVHMGIELADWLYWRILRGETWVSSLNAVLDCALDEATEERIAQASLQKPTIESQAVEMARLIWEVTLGQDYQCNHFARCAYDVATRMGRRVWFMWGGHHMWVVQDRGSSLIHIDVGNQVILEIPR